MTVLNLTERKLVGMLTENTGRAMCDSGGAYGRNWERNQGRNFKAEPATRLGRVAEYVADGTNYEPEVMHNVFHFCAENLTYDAAMNRRWQAYAKPRRADDYEMALMESFPIWLRDERGQDVTGPYGGREPMTVNTYNGEDLLSQVLQYTAFVCDDICYVLLQIHGGCDVRGGYTDAVCFRDDDNELSLTRNANATIYSDAPPPAAIGDMFGGKRAEQVYWITDDGWHWYRDGASGWGAGKSLRDYPISRAPEHKGDGQHVWIDGDGFAHCPINGTRLQAGY